MIATLALRIVKKELGGLPLGYGLGFANFVIVPVEAKEILKDLIMINDILAGTNSGKKKSPQKGNLKTEQVPNTSPQNDANKP